MPGEIFRQGRERLQPLSLRQAARRGSFLALGLVLVALLAFPLAPAAARDVNARDADSRDASDRDVIQAVRVWPSPDYTRLTIESKTPLRHTLSVVPNPARVVLDIENIDLADLNRELAGKLSPQDPYVSQIRTGQFRPNIVRVVLDLRTDVKPQIFTLAPVDDYGNRLVLDLYATTPADPLLALLKTLPAQNKDVARDTGSAAPQRDDKAAAKPTITRPLTIVIDPGHGGEDPGAKGRGGSFEKDVTLLISHKLKSLINDEDGMRAVLTRESDYFLDLRARVDRARAIKADLFVSIHADSYTQSDARGSSVFALSDRGATSVAARMAAERENKADLIGGVSLDFRDRYLAQTLLDLSQTATINHSLKLGRAVLHELGGFTPLHKEYVEQAGFAVLKAPDIPSILVETAFISNPEEEKKLNDEAYQDRMARAILTGIKRYFAQNPPTYRGTTIASNAPSPAGGIVLVGNR